MPVPAYDARGTGFDFGKGFKDFASILPVFEGEIPKGSLATVLYTANTFKKSGAGQFSGEKQLSLNIQAVIVLGTVNE